MKRLRNTTTPRKGTNKMLYIIAALLSLLCFMFVTAVGCVQAHAATTAYSNVLSDLQKDVNFKETDYPKNTKDYSLSVIQIAESTDGELFIYVYQPSSETVGLRATTVRLSTQTGDNAKYYDFKLTYLSANGTLYKYKVENLTVLPINTRYYSIVAIHRKWDSTIDEATGNDNTVNEVVYEVGQLWTVKTVAGEIQYSMTYIETITVTDKYVDFLRYSNGFKLYNDSCDSHYIAFSTDKQIDKLLEADVSYVYRYCELTYLFGIETNSRYTAPIKEEITLTYDQKSSNAADGWFATKYTWNRIESVSEFIAKENLTPETQSEVKNKQWVLRFAETDYTATHNVTALTGEQYYEVTEVTILRLKFETAGKTYNLGVVDNKQSGDLIPGNVQTAKRSVPWWAWVILAVIVIILLWLILGKPKAKIVNKNVTATNKKKKKGKKK